MNFGSKKRMVVVAATTLAVVGGGAAAVAATGSGSHGSDFLDSVAKHLGVTPQKLEDATKAAAIDQVNADLAAGRITQAQADELKKRIEAGDGVLGGPRGPGFGRRVGGFAGPAGPGLGRPAIANEIAAAATYLGLSEADLRTRLRDGQSLADVAKAQSKDVAGLKTAILDAAKADLDKAVADKKLTQSQADDISNGLKAHIDDIVDANVKLRFRGPGGPGGPGMGFGFGADSAAAAKYLGLDESALRDKLRAGQSLADVAKAQSKDVQGLEDAIVASQKARLDQAVSDKKLTRSQADDVLAKLKSRVDDLVNAKPADRPAFRGRRGARPRFFFGP